MKLKSLLIGTAASLIFLGSTANANIVIQSINFAGGDICSSVDGIWTGSGKMSALGGMVKCEYSGKAIVIKVDAANNYSVKVDLQKDSGSGLCPGAEDLVLDGSCNNNTITLKSDQVHLSGGVADDGKSVGLSGYVDVVVAGQNVKADVHDMNLHKQ